MMEPSFEKLLAKLLEHEVAFIVVGGLAVTLNGYVRLTEDVDVLVSLDQGNVNRFIQALSEFGEGFGGELTPEDFSDEPGAIRIVEEVEHCHIDAFTQMADRHYEDLIDGAEVSAVNGKPFHYASKSQLIEFKSTSGREKDQIDISALRQLIKDPDAFR